MRARAAGTALESEDKFMDQRYGPDRGGHNADINKWLCMKKSEREEMIEKCKSVIREILLEDEEPVGYYNIGTKVNQHQTGKESAGDCATTFCLDAIYTAANQMVKSGTVMKREYDANRYGRPRNLLFTLHLDPILLLSDTVKKASERARCASPDSEKQ